jgi:hypothetical protein
VERSAVCFSFEIWQHLLFQLKSWENECFGFLWEIPLRVLLFAYRIFVVASAQGQALPAASLRMFSTLARRVPEEWTGLTQDGPKNLLVFAQQCFRPTLNL